MTDDGNNDDDSDDDDDDSEWHIDDRCCIPMCIRSFVHTLLRAWARACVGYTRAGMRAFVSVSVHAFAHAFVACMHACVQTK